MSWTLVLFLARINNEIFTPTEEKNMDIVADVPYGRVMTYVDVVHAVKPQCTLRFISWALSQAPPNRGLPRHRILTEGRRIAVTESKTDEQKSLLKEKALNFRIIAHDLNSIGLLILIRYSSERSA